MKKTFNVNVGGYAFLVEEDAYVELDNYISEISSVYSGDSAGGVFVRLSALQL